MSARNLGFITDSIFHRLNGIIEEKDRYTVIRTPSNPGYFWGNLLYFEKAPTEGCFELWLECFREEFGEDCGHVTFAWNEDIKGSIEPFIKVGFEWDETVVLKLAKPIFEFQMNETVDVRPITTDKEWQAVVDLQIHMSEQEKTPEFIEFKEKAFASMRSIQEQGYGAWWGAFLDGKLVGDMGLFFDFETKVGRFQSVETHPDYQNQRICKTILKSVMTDAIEDKGISDLVIVTEPSNHALNIYRSCGFVDHSRQFGFCLRRPYWKQSS